MCYYTDKGGAKLNTRFKLIRTERHLSQEEFGKRIGIESRSHISALENGNRTITDRIINDVCREFNVNETWLRTGEGEMFKQRTPEDEVGYYVADLLDYDGNGNPFFDMIIEMMKKYHELDDKSKAVIRGYFKEVSDSIKKETEN